MGIVDFLNTYRKYDPAAKSLIEVALLYPGPKAILFHRLAHQFYNLEFYFIARFIAEVSRWITLIEIHPGAKIGDNLFIDHGCGVVIGETTIIGNDCLIYHGVTLGGVNRDGGKRHPTLENGVLVGSGAKVLGNIILGTGCMVGANSVVTKDVEAGTTVAGVPARPIG